jgi:hypothetical protein
VGGTGGRRKSESVLNDPGPAALPCALPHAQRPLGGIYIQASGAQNGRWAPGTGEAMGMELQGEGRRCAGEPVKLQGLVGSHTRPARLPEAKLRRTAGG